VVRGGGLFNLASRAKRPERTSQLTLFDIVPCSSALTSAAREGFTSTKLELRHGRSLRTKESVP
jgi:hypothetical protein